MPFFERNFSGEGRDPSGKVVGLPPSIALARIGPVLQVTVGPTPQAIEALTEAGKDIPNPVSGLAIIDTGATVTAVDERVCQSLGLSPTGIRETAHAGGRESRACYPVSMTFPGTPLPNIVSPSAMSVNLGESQYILLLGRDLLSGMKFVYNGVHGRFEISI